MARQRNGYGFLNLSMLVRQGKASGLLLILTFVWAIFFCPEIHGASKSPHTGNPIVGTVPQKVDDVFTQDPRNFVVETFVEGLEVPWELVFLPDGRALVTERPGRIRMIDKGKLLDTPYASFHVSSVGEGGLMGLALHPDYPREPYLYVMYTYRDGFKLYNKVERLRDTGKAAVPDKVIVEKLPAARFHNGGRISFGPDRMLYVCTGDATHPETAQDRAILGGKILRFTPEGSIPKDNPFGNSPVYAFGLRNPQGLAWDPETGSLFSSVHGPTGEFGLYGKDSVNIIQKGGNYGWPRVLGKVDMKPYVDPIVFWPKATPPAGMTFFRRDLYIATLKAESLIRIGLERTGRGYTVTTIERLFGKDWSSGKYGRLRDVVVGPDSNLYVLTSNRDGRGNARKGDDKILKLTYKR
jgi:glucose/arabinose dehydrogenase